MLTCIPVHCPECRVVVTRVQAVGFFAAVPMTLLVQPVAHELRVAVVLKLPLQRRHGAVAGVVVHDDLGRRGEPLVKRSVDVEHALG